MVTLAIDVETNARDVRYDPLFRVLGVSFANSEGESEYVALGHRGLPTFQMDLAMSRLRSHMECATRIIFHNAKFDLRALQRIGFDLRIADWYDTMLMAHMLDENLPNKGLDYLGKLYFNEGKEKDEEFTRFVDCFGWEFLPEWMIKPYAIQDAKLTLKLFDFLYPKFVEYGYVS